MKVLFVCSGNKKYEDSPIVTGQGDALTKAGIDLEYFFIVGKGIKGYVRNLYKLKKHLKENHYDLVHAHYSLSGFIASFAGKQPLVVSLMGSDVHRLKIFHSFIKTCNRWRWSKLIVKSDEMKKLIGIDCAYVIPNGVDIEKFYPISRHEAKNRVGYNQGKNVIFVGNPERPEKNFKLAEESIFLLKDKDIKLNVISQHPHNKIPDYMNAADVLLLTSIYEGSPNVIKEAMACNCPIVATDVGDIKWVIGSTAGCFLTTFSPEDVARKVSLALADDQRTDGRKRIVELGLNSEAIAKKIMEVYESIAEAMPGKQKKAVHRC